MKFHVFCPLLLLCYFLLIECVTGRLSGFGLEGCGSSCETLSYRRSSCHNITEMEALQEQLAKLQEEKALLEKTCLDRNAELDATKHAFAKLKRESQCFEPSEDAHVYLKKESKRIKKLKGKPKEEVDVDVEEWVEDVQNYFETRKLSQRDRVEFIYEHIDGKVRSELRYRPEEDKRDSDSILAIIQQVFGESESLSVLQETFFRRVQKEGETLLEYSLALMQLFDKIQKCSGGGSLRNVDKTLKDKFTEGIRDETFIN